MPKVGYSDTLARADFRAHVERGDALPEACHVVVEGGTYIGYSELFRRREGGMLQQETTAYRRRGVALALKLRGVIYAQAHGYRGVNTGMAPNNAAVVALNARLGFVAQQAFVTFRKLT